MTGREASNLLLHPTYVGPRLSPSDELEPWQLHPGILIHMADTSDYATARGFERVALLALLLLTIGAAALAAREWLQAPPPRDISGAFLVLLLGLLLQAVAPFLASRRLRLAAAFGTIAALVGFFLAR